MALVGWWGWLLGGEYGVMIGLLVGFCIGSALAAWLVPSRMLVYNAEWTGYVTQNAFKGTMVSYGPGLHFSHWWEERNKNGNYSLKVITRSDNTSVATKTAQLTSHFEYEYAIYLPTIERAIGVDSSTIERGLTAFIDSFITGWCARRDADEARTHIEELNEALANEFMAHAVDQQDAAGFEKNYGFITVSVVVSSMAFAAAAQKTRDAMDEAVALHEVVARIYGYTSAAQKVEFARKIQSGEITVDQYNTMLSRAMAASDNNTTVDLKVIETAGIPALLKELLERFGKGGSKS
jgi:hypothetical protein